MHADSVCVTLTYSDENLPEHGSLRRVHASQFIRALRQLVARRGGEKFSFDCTGEYSPLPKMRPHYHVALFGYVPPDPKIGAKSRAGNQEYSSAELSKAWQDKGRVTFQHWSTGAAQYCASHQAWKLTGDKGRAQRMVYGPDGEAIAEREPEFHQPSTRPGIGRRFFEKYGAQALGLGFTVVNGREVPVPSYYLRRADEDPELVALAEAARVLRRAQAVESVAKLEAEGLEVRLDAIEYCAQDRIDRGARSHGGGGFR